MPRLTSAAKVLLNDAVCQRCKPAAITAAAPFDLHLGHRQCTVTQLLVAASLVVSLLIAQLLVVDELLRLVQDLLE